MLGTYPIFHLIFQKLDVWKSRLFLNYCHDIRNHLYITKGDRGGGSGNDNFSLFYVLEMSLRRGVGEWKKAKTPLRIIKMVPNSLVPNMVKHILLFANNTLLLFDGKMLGIVFSLRL